MCKNISETLLENVIEITWMFDGLEKSGKIKSWNELMDEYGSDGVKSVIKQIAEEFERKYPFDITWVDTELDYIVEIEKFAKEELIEEFGENDNNTKFDMIDGVTTCCGYDFGTDEKKIRFCPICGKKITKRT